jgi:hypothetical protein
VRLTLELHGSRHDDHDHGIGSSNSRIAREMDGYVTQELGSMLETAVHVDMDNIREWYIPPPCALPGSYGQNPDRRNALLWILNVEPFVLRQDPCCLDCSCHCC